ncbi:hypothetical protein M8C21_003642, partial [Ambrosia artemisiifolia]
ENTKGEDKETYREINEMRRETCDCRGKKVISQQPAHIGRLESSIEVPESLTSMLLKRFNSESAGVSLLIIEHK